MNLREAAQQALEALEYIHTETSAYEDELIHAAIIALRAALEPVTTCHELYETACANATYKVIDYFCHTTACSDVNVTYIRKILDEFAEQAICCKGGDKLSLPFDHFADAGKMVGECAYQECLSTNGCEKQCPAFPRSKDDHIPDATKMVATIRPEVTVDTVQSSHIKELYSVDEIRKKIESNDYCAELLLQHAMMHLMGNVEPVAWMVYTLDGQSAFVTDNPAGLTPEHRALPLYTAPPKREPLTDEEISKIFIYCGRDKETFARAIERAHGIGGEE